MSGHDSILEVLQEDVKRAPSGHKAEQIAALMGKGYSTLMNELNGSIPGHKFGLLQLIPLMQATGSTRPLDYLCGAMGCVCLSLPAGLRPLASAERDAIRAVREFGELMATLGDALGDGSISAEEGRRIKADGYEALRAIIAIVSRAEEAERVRS